MAEQLDRAGLIKALHSQSTWQLLSLSLVTFGVYTSYYIRRQTRIINKHLTGGDGIPEGFALAIIVFAWLSVALIVPYVLVEEGHPVETISNVMDRAWSIMALIWAFMARSKMNTLLSSVKKEPEWFHGFWTFLFNALYFNYKVNTLYETLPDRTIQLS